MYHWPTWPLDGGRASLSVGLAPSRVTVAASGTRGHHTQEHATNTTRPSSTTTIIGLRFRIKGRNDEAQTLRITVTTQYTATGGLPAQLTNP